MYKSSLHVLIVFSVLLGAALLTRSLWPSNAVLEDSDSLTGVQPDTTLVTLPPGKLQSAGIEIVPAIEASMQPTRTISGRLDYDQSRHVALKAACEGILTEVRVRPGDLVRSGDVVAVVSSPEVGRARSNVHTQAANVRLAETQWRWQQKLCHGVEQLVELIRAGKSPAEIEQQLANESLGEYRERLVGAYTRTRLAAQIAAGSRDAASRGTIAERLQQQRESELQTSEAAIESVADQSLFETRQQCKKAELDWDAAKRDLDVSLQALNMLLGPAAEPVTASQIEADSATPHWTVNLVSPIDGTIEDQMISATERVSVGQSVFVIADTSHLWAVGDVRESDWSAIMVDVGQTVTVTAPALPDKTYLAEVLIVGRRVNPTSGAAPLVTTLTATDARLRPGLFIRMTVPAGPPRVALLVPAQAVVVHEGQSFVFVAESDVEFRRVDVEAGATENGMREIHSGLESGDRVAARGVFKLKSELLLAGEDQ